MSISSTINQCNVTDLCFSLFPAIHRAVLSFVSCFAGGVFLSACLLDIIPDYLSDIHEVLRKQGLDVSSLNYSELVQINHFHASNTNSPHLPGGLPACRVHHGMWLLHSLDLRKNGSELHRGPQKWGDGSSFSSRGSRTCPWTALAEWSGGEWSSRPRGSSRALVLPLLHALPVPLSPLCVWGFGHWLADHRYQGDLLSLVLFDDFVLSHTVLTLLENW